MNVQYEPIIPYPKYLNLEVFGARNFPPKYYTSIINYTTSPVG